MDEDGGRPVLGWYVVGPMEAVCVEHAATVDDARARYGDPNLEVVPLYKNSGVYRCAEGHPIEASQLGD